MNPATLFSRQPLRRSPAPKIDSPDFPKVVTRPKAGRYVIARNAHGGPTLQHRAGVIRLGKTVCGVDFTGWSRAYSADPIPAVLCKRCKAIGER